MGNSEAALGAIGLNRVKHGSTKNINKIAVCLVQPVSAEGRKSR
jgi:hypothetical protein